MTFSFRPAAEADFERLLDLSIRTMRPQLEAAGRWDPVRRRARMRAGFDPATMRLIEQDGRLAGCVAVTLPPGGDVELSAFYIEPALQGRGLGAAVLRALLAELAGREIRLEVLKGSPAARLYERHGFRRTGETAHDWLYARPAQSAPFPPTPADLSKPDHPEP
jgi:ribosomal protein S18 acetylase RimI-like enzyme